MAAFVGLRAFTMATRPADAHTANVRCNIVKCCQMQNLRAIPERQAHGYNVRSPFALYLMCSAYCATCDICPCEQLLLACLQWFTAHQPKLATSSGKWPADVPDAHGGVPRDRGYNTQFKLSVFGQYVHAGSC